MSFVSVCDTRAMPDQPRPTHQVVKRNVATGGRVIAIARRFDGRARPFFCEADAIATAAAYNRIDGREGRNVIWTVRRITA